MPTRKAGSPASIAAAEKIAKVMRLRRAGVDYQTIADKHYNGDRSNCRRAILREIKKTVQEPAAELLVWEAERLNDFLAALHPQAMRGNVGAVNASLKVIDQRAKLLGLYPAQQIEQVGNGQIAVVFSDKLAPVTSGMAEPEITIARDE